MSHRARIHASLAALLLFAASCGSGDDTPQTTAATPTTEAAEAATTATAADPAEPIFVVATTTILADIVSNIVGEDARIEVLLPPGADPHDYQLSSAQVVLIYEADLVVANGLRLEEGLIAVLETAEEEGVNIIELAGSLDPIPFSFEADHHDDEADHDEHEEMEEEGHHDHDDEADHDEHEEMEEEGHHDHDDEGHHDEHEEMEEEGHHDHDHEGGDPHFWTDPLRAAKAASLIAEALSEIAPSIDWSSRADEYASRLLELDVEIQEILASIPEENRKLITNHDSLGYFADRYGFEIIGTVIPGGATLADPSSAELAALVEEIREEGVTVIFAETIDSTALAEAVAAEAGAEVSVVELYTGSLGEEGTATGTLIGMLRYNAQQIAEALG